MTIFIAIVVTTPAPTKGSDLHSHLLFHLPHTEIKSYVCILGQYYNFFFLFRILVDVIFMGYRMPSLSLGRWYRTIFSEYRECWWQTMAVAFMIALSSEWMIFIPVWVQPSRRQNNAWSASSRSCAHPFIRISMHWLPSFGCLFNLSRSYNIETEQLSQWSKDLNSHRISLKRLFNRSKTKPFILSSEQSGIMSSRDVDGIFFEREVQEAGICGISTKSIIAWWNYPWPR